MCLHTPRFSYSLYQLATCRWSLCGATDGYISHVYGGGGWPAIINETSGKEIVAGCRVPAVEFLPRECCGILLPALKRLPRQRRRHFVSGSSTFSCTSLFGTVVQSAVTCHRSVVSCPQRSERRQNCASAGISLVHLNASYTYSTCTHKYSNLVGRGCGKAPRMAHRSSHGVNSSNDGKQFVCVCACVRVCMLHGVLAF